MLVFSPAEFRIQILSSKRLLGLDVGEKTIGLAMCDAGWSVASGLETLKKGKFADDLAQLAQIVHQHKIGGLVIGYPLNMDGSIGPRAQSVKQFGRNLEKHLGLPTLLWDERMSTIAVENVMLEADLSRQKRKKQVDKLAAAYILQSMLDSLR